MNTKRNIIILLLGILPLWVNGSTNILAALATPPPRWLYLVAPHEWPKDPDGSNAITRCALFSEEEMAKAETFLLTRSHSILEGGIKNDVPHVVVPYPNFPSDQWTIFFTKQDHKPYSIERKGKRTYRIQIDSRSKRVTNLSSEEFSLFCDPPGCIRDFSVSLGNNRQYTLRWDAQGHKKTEAVYDWKSRGQALNK